MLLISFYYKSSSAIFKSGYLNLKSSAWSLFGITFCVSKTTVDICPSTNLKASDGTHVLGQMSTVVLDTQKVIPNKLQALDFKFKYPDLKIALEDLVH